MCAGLAGLPEVSKGPGKRWAGTRKGVPRLDKDSAQAGKLDGETSCKVVSYSEQRSAVPEARHWMGSRADFEAGAVPSACASWIPQKDPRNETCRGLKLRVRGTPCTHCSCPVLSTGLWIGQQMGKGLSEDAEKNTHSENQESMEEDARERRTHRGQWTKPTCRAAGNRKEK